jgi:hypothetical protein
LVHPAGGDGLPVDQHRHLSVGGVAASAANAMPTFTYAPGQPLFGLLPVDEHDRHQQTIPVRSISRF